MSWRTDDADGNLIAEVSITEDAQISVETPNGTTTMDLIDADHFRSMLDLAIGRARRRPARDTVPYTSSST